MEKLNSWSYSHFLYRLRQPFVDELTYDKLMALTVDQSNQLISRILNECNNLQRNMRNQSITLRPNKLYIQCFDVDYLFPPDYKFINKCQEFVKSSGFIVFDHLNRFDVIRKYLTYYAGPLSRAQHPVTGDTLWHMNPFMMDMMHAEIQNLYNFRMETPNERRILAELLDFPLVQKFPEDVENLWTDISQIYVVGNCIVEREPLTLCKFIKKSK